MINDMMNLTRSYTALPRTIILVNNIVVQCLDFNLLNVIIYV